MATSGERRQPCCGGSWLCDRNRTSAPDRVKACPNYPLTCPITRPHYHFKTNDGERVMFTDHTPKASTNGGTP